MTINNKKRIRKPEPRLPAGMDRRVKIPKEDHEYIRSRVLVGRESQRAIAREYGVDKRLIGFIVHPERLAQNILLRKARGGSKRYYDKDKWRETQREHRAYVRSIIKKENEKL